MPVHTVPTPGHSWASRPDMSFRWECVHSHRAQLPAFLIALQISAVVLALLLKLKEVVGSPQQRTDHIRLTPNHFLSRTAAFDLNPLNSNSLRGVSMTSGYSTELGEHDKHSKNEVHYAELGWMCHIGC